MCRLFFAKLVVTLGIGCLCFLTGCGPRAPEGFPKTTSCTVTITDGDRSMEGVFVQINTVPPTSSLSVVAKTDAQGNAVPQTQLGTYAISGVPVGPLVMTLLKTPQAKDFKSPQELENMNYDQATAYSREMEARRSKLPPIIPPALTVAETSPLTLNAERGKPVNWKVDLSEYKNR